MYIKDPKDPPPHNKLLELIKKFSKFAIFKINTQNSVAFLNTEQSENNILKFLIV